MKSSHVYPPASEGEHQPGQIVPITLNNPISKSGFMDLPKVIYIIIPIRHMAEESNEEGLSDGHGINKVFLDLSIEHSPCSRIDLCPRIYFDNSMITPLFLN